MKDGGPAFPVYGSEKLYTPEGMSLRDWFAGQVLAGWSEGELIIEPDAAAAYCYALADAMLKAREEET
jgi:hypothetical protein